jgi:RHS repeat-associated protein
MKSLSGCTDRTRRIDHRHILVQLITPLLAPLAVSGGFGWTAMRVALASILMAWDPAPTLSQRFASVLPVIRGKRPRHAVGGTHLLLTRDTDNNSSVNHTLDYDAVGNMISDGNDTYIYDAFGRLRKVISATLALVAEYRYNALGFKIAWHYDTMTTGTPPTPGPDGAVTSADPWYFFCFDERWRIVATFRGSDAEPKEVFVRHAAGLDGRGGSSYIDSVILRDRDANTDWTEASDGTLEERIYYCQTGGWRADVSVVLTSGGPMSGCGLERAKYLACGRVCGMPAGDLNGNGINDIDDATDLMNLISVGGYRVAADLNLDGKANAADLSSFSWGSMGWGTLSLAGNRFGYAGYQHAPELAGAKWEVRNRWLDSVTGVWNRRDPLGYIDGMNLYQYVRGMALVGVDPMGLITSPASCHATCYPSTMAMSSTCGSTTTTTTNSTWTCFTECLPHWGGGGYLWCLATCFGRQPSWGRACDFFFHGIPEWDTNCSDHPNCEECCHDRYAQRLAWIATMTMYRYCRCVGRGWDLETCRRDADGWERRHLDLEQDDLLACLANCPTKIAIAAVGVAAE